MKHNREFEIAWQGLKPGVHTFQYEIGDRFMEDRQVERDFRELEAKLTVKFDKQTSFFLLHVDIDGSVLVPCDRCGDEFKMRLWDEFDLLIKLAGDEADEIDDESDVVFIPRSETVIDLGNWLYEFVMLSIPLQRVHPENPDGSQGCNPQALKLLSQLAEPGEEAKHDIWKGLENLDEPKAKAKKKG